MKPMEIDLEAVFLRRQDLLAICRELRADAEHDRHVGTVDIPVDDADAAAVFRQRDRKVDRDRGLSDAALAGADGDDVLHSFDRRPSGFGRGHGAHARGHFHIHGGDTRQCRHRGVRLVAQHVLYGTRGSRQLDGERHAAAVDAEILDESKRHDVPVQIGILDDRQRAEHRRFSDHTQMIMTEREAEVEMWI
jgi:hypothetical protein